MNFQTNFVMNYDRADLDVQEHKMLWGLGCSQDSLRSTNYRKSCKEIRHC